jgi:electron transport protein HydN
MVRPQDRKFVAADPDKCTGCTLCEYACSMANEGVFNPTKSRIRAVRLGPLSNMTIACRHCEEPDCVAACPRDALSQDESNWNNKVDDSA